MEFVYKMFMKDKGLDFKPHQMKGFEWCLEQEKSKFGGVLADEMGLGKTITMLSLIVLNPKRNNLIVVPPALLKQWRFVMKKLSINSWVYRGSVVKGTTVQSIQNPQVVLTTYGMISTRKKGYKSILWDVNWDRVIFDEAHNMKNRKSNTFSGAIKIKSEIKWMVTGTPIQNRPEDIYSLAIILGEKIRGNEHLMEFITKRLLRRTKTGIGLEIPKKNVKIVKVNFESKEEEELSRQIHSYCNFSRVTVTNVDRAIQSMEGPNPLVMFIRARQICIDPSLIVDNLKRIQEFDGQLQDCVFNEISTKSKINAIIEHIKKGKKEDKKIIFCHYRKESDYFKEKLVEIGYKVCVLDGRTKRGEFGKICKSLDYDVFLGQIKTASEGLNLQQYSQIYFTSPHWNPAVEDQCIARCHRIGQEKNVEVFKFMMKWSDKNDSSYTLDEYANLVQEKKRQYMDMIEK